MHLNGIPKYFNIVMYAGQCPVSAMTKPNLTVLSPPLDPLIPPPQSIYAHLHSPPMYGAICLA